MQYTVVFSMKFNISHLFYFLKLSKIHANGSFIIRAYLLFRYLSCLCYFHVYVKRQLFYQLFQLLDVYTIVMNNAGRLFLLLLEPCVLKFQKSAKSRRTRAWTPSRRPPAQPTRSANPARSDRADSKCILHLINY